MCGKIPPVHFIPDQISLGGIIICFYIGYLFRKPTIKTASTIKNYAGQLRTSWSKMGTELSAFDVAVYCDMKKGVEHLLPQKPDTRAAFLLPHYNLSPVFETRVTHPQVLLNTAVIWGFLGMFRFSTYKKLGVHNLVIVGRDGHEYKLVSGTRRELNHYFNRCGAIGFYFRFSDKYHPIAHAFYCRLDGISRFWSIFCPVQALLALATAGRLTETLFPAKIITSKDLGHYLVFIARVKNLVPGSKFTPHSLRIGGHTFVSIKNVYADFLHFLRRRAV